MDALDEELRLEEDLALERKQQGLLSFTQAMYGETWRTNWHHRAACRMVNYVQERRTARELLASFGIKGKELTRQLLKPHPKTGLYAGLTHPDAIDKPLRNVQLHVPPQTGKSEIISRNAPAWILGRDPNRRIICASYSALLSQGMGQDVLSIIENPHYKALFPKTRLAGDVTLDEQERRERNVKNANMFKVVGYRGRYKNAGVGGSTTGFSADDFIIDDAVKNRQDAESPTKRDTNWKWFQNVAVTRLSRDASMYIINTRFHERDLSGATLAQAQQNPKAMQWFSLIFPAVLDCDPTPGDPRIKHGESLWPYKATPEQWDEIKNTVSVYTWESLYQQRPTPPEGAIIKSSWLRYWDHLPEGLQKFTLSADLTFKERQDFCVLQVWASKGADHYLVDQIRDRLPFTGQLKAFRSLCQKYPQIRVKLVEDAANGAALIDTVRREIPGVIGVKPEGSKEIRLDAASPLIEAGNVYLPSPKRAPWVDELVHELISFPSAAHDDQVDAATQYLLRVQKRTNYGLGALPIGVGKTSYWEQGDMT